VNAASDCNQAADQPLAVVVDLDQTAMAVWAAAHQTISPNYSRLALPVATVVDAVSRQRLTAAPSLSACALISLPR
jgi:hypothetical protein